jgi:hypothetical protein
MAQARLVGESGGALDLRWRCHGGSLELGQPTATEIGLLWGFTLRDRGDEADPLHLPRGSGRR